MVSLGNMPNRPTPPLSRNRLGDHPIHTAVKSGSTECVKLLIERNMGDITARTEGGRNCALIAAEYGNLDMLKTIFELEADGPVSSCRSNTAEELRGPQWQSSAACVLCPG